VCEWYPISLFNLCHIFENVPTKDLDFQCHVVVLLIFNELGIIMWLFVLLILVELLAITPVLKKNFLSMTQIQCHAYYVWLPWRPLFLKLSLSAEGRRIL
jgi:hypothetical protein